MKILFITLRFPYPPAKGDQAVVYNRLKYLSKKHDITLLSLYQNDKELQGIEKVRPFCANICMVKLPRWKSFFNVLWYGLFSAYPLQVLYYRSPTFFKRIQSILKAENFDLVHAYLLRSAPYLQNINAPKVLELIDSMQLNFARRLELSEGLERRVIYEELKRVTAYEKSIGKTVEHMIVVADADKELLDCNNASAIPLGVATDFFCPNHNMSKPYTIVFSGNMDYSPNDQAVRWFVENCFSRVEKLVPHVHFIVAGRNPSEMVKKYGERTNITVTGFVESMPRLLNQAQIAIAPMQSGSGMQFKILEAMACGLPVVTTTLGLGDIKASLDKEILVADHPNDFVQVVARLLNCPELSGNIGDNARDYIMNNHSWVYMTETVDRIYDMIVNGQGEEVI